jgi:hypothetical protein
MKLFDLFKRKETLIEGPKEEIKNLYNDVQPLDGGEETQDQTAKGYIYREPPIYGVSLLDWKHSVIRAWSELLPDRIGLCDIYTAMTTYDAQVSTVIHQRKLLTMQGDVYLYNEDGSINEEATKLIKSPSGAHKRWFRDFCNYSLDSIFFGFELITLNIINNEIIIRKVPERNVIPNQQVMMRDARIRNVESNLIHFDKKEFDLITCKVSYTNNANDLGLLSTMAPYFFSKVTGNWKAHADKFGMLTRILKTNSENATRLANSYNALKNQVRGNYIILGQGEELTFEGDMRTVLPYKELNDSMDEQIAKIALGQTSTTDQKSYAGSANVHKLILDSYVRSDREFLESVINDQLVPKLQLLGFLPKNVYFGISESVDINLVEQSTVIMNLAKAGFKPTKEYIEQIFDMDIDDTVVAPIIPPEDINNNITI